MVRSEFGIGWADWAGEHRAVPKPLSRLDESAPPVVKRGFVIKQRPSEGRSEKSRLAGIKGAALINRNRNLDAVLESMDEEEAQGEKS